LKINIREMVTVFVIIALLLTEHATNEMDWWSAVEVHIENKRFTILNRWAKAQ